MGTNYKGIDYSLGQSNINHETGIHYGVIPFKEVALVWFGESEACYFYSCPECGYEFGNDYPEKETCPECGIEFDDYTFDCLEPASFYFEDKEYSAEQGAEDVDIFILRSPYFTYSQYCSPCAPGAGYLMNPLNELDENNKTYCFGHDWFEDGKAPYPVYSVKTGGESGGIIKGRIGENESKKTTSLRWDGASRTAGGACVRSHRDCGSQVKRRES